MDASMLYRCTVYSYCLCPLLTFFGQELLLLFAVASALELVRKVARDLEVVDDRGEANHDLGVLK